MHWRRKWQPTPVFLPGESQGRGDWWAAIYGATQSRTQLKQLSSSSNFLLLNFDHQVPQLIKNSLAMQETLVQFLGQEDPLEKRQATHFSILGLPWWLSW